MEVFFAQLSPEQAEAVGRALSETTGAALHTKDCHGRYSSINRKYLDVLKLTPEEVLGKRPRDLFSADIAEELESTDLAVLSTGQGIEREERFQQSGGELVILSSSITPIVDGGGRVLGVLGVAQDITERKRRERRLHFLSSLSEVVVSPGSLTHTFVGLAKAAVPLFADLCAVDLIEEDGELRRELVYHTDEQFSQKEKEAFFKWPPRVGDPYGGSYVMGTKKPQMVSRVTDEMLRKTAQSDEHFHYLKQLDIRSLISLPLVSHGGVVGVLSLILYGDRPSYSEDDLESAAAMSARTAELMDHALAYQEARTEIELRKGVQADLELARDKALHATQSKSDFLARVSHEIRTPLTGLVGILELLQSEEGMSETIREKLQIADECAGSMLAIANDILDLSQVEAGKLRLRSEPFEPRPVVYRSVSLFEPKAREKGLKLKLDIKKETPQALLGDSNRVGQVLSNFVSNAVKYTSTGTIVVSISMIDGCLRIEVSDTGPGLSPGKLNSLFKPYERGDMDQEQPDTVGAGLGLAITRELVEMMGGKLGVHDNAPTGATFWAELPMQEATCIKAVNSTAADGSAKRTGKILVVEDNTVNRQILLAQLRSLGHEVIGAENGQQALERVSQAGDLDLIFMDCQMPVLNGFEATRRLRQEQLVAAATPIIALTANSFETQQERCLAAGMTDFLSKPCSLAELQSMISKWLEPSSPVGGGTRTPIAVTPEVAKEA